MDISLNDLEINPESYPKFAHFTPMKNGTFNARILLNDEYSVRITRYADEEQTEQEIQQNDIWLMIYKGDKPIKNGIVSDFNEALKTVIALYKRLNDI